MATACGHTHTHTHTHENGLLHYKVKLCKFLNLQVHTLLWTSHLPSPCLLLERVQCAHLTTRTCRSAPASHRGRWTCATVAFGADGPCVVAAVGGCGKEPGQSKGGPPLVAAAAAPLQQPSGLVTTRGTHTLGSTMTEQARVVVDCDMAF